MRGQRLAAVAVLAMVVVAMVADAVAMAVDAMAVDAMAVDAGSSLSADGVAAGDGQPRACGDGGGPTSMVGARLTTPA